MTSQKKSTTLLITRSDLAYIFWNYISIEQWFDRETKQID